MYMRGVDATEQTLTAPQLLRYLAIAVQDEVSRAQKLNPDGTFEAELREIKRGLKSATPDMPGALRLTTMLVGAVNTFLEEQQTYVCDHNPPDHPEGPGAMVPVPNADTRYAMEPSTEETGYYHSSLSGKTEPYWGNDDTMREKTGRSLGPVVAGGAQQEQPRLQSHARGGANLPLTRLTLIPPEHNGKPYTFWQGPGQDLQSAQAELDQQPRGTSGTMMSPWLEIVLS